MIIFLIELCMNMVKDASVKKEIQGVNMRDLYSFIVVNIAVRVNATPFNPLIIRRQPYKL